MKENNKILLPGGFKQFRILKQKCDLNNKKILIIGESSEKIAEKFILEGAESVDVIVRDYESLIHSKLNIELNEKISIRINDFENTDFEENRFDIVYSQASLTNTNRKNTIKEIKRILKSNGILCISEITKLKSKIPTFVQNIFEQSEMIPLLQSEFEQYFTSKGFEIIYKQDLTSSLKDFYQSTQRELIEYLKSSSEKEKNFYKKLLNKISHESNAYLKLGADKYIGLNLLIMKNIK
ncbi:MAG: methyltransferase domain-containing protein [Ignavibacterium sp.]|nr:methyltransferase domain-containing protein [Ignavibacterium sp.]MCX7610147.1 methyltransferase domain-containing protein [Ignavibacterium sp.]MDW8375332.1 methyltransferase domain-containing protein [Ignavibacteriales bacterium]